MAELTTKEAWLDVLGAVDSYLFDCDGMRVVKMVAWTVSVQATRGFVVPWLS